MFPALDPVFLLLLGLVLGVVGFLYLLARRALDGLREGFEEGMERDR